MIMFKLKRSSRKQFLDCLKAKIMNKNSILLFYSLAVQSTQIKKSRKGLK